MAPGSGAGVGRRSRAPESGAGVGRRSRAPESGAGVGRRSRAPGSGAGVGENGPGVHFQRGSIFNLTPALLSGNKSVT